MNNFIFLFLIMTIASCNNSDNKKNLNSNSEPKQPSQDQLIDSNSTPVISQGFLFSVGLYFGTDRPLLGMGCESAEGITKSEQIKALEKFQQHVVRLNRTQDVKWFMGERSHMIFESYLSFTPEEVEGVIENALDRLKSGGCQKVIGGLTDSALFKKINYFESRTKYKTNHCFVKVDDSLNETYLVAIDSQDSKQNIYYSTLANLNSCQASLSMNVSPVHRFFANADTFEQFNCYKNKSTDSSFYLLKEIKTNEEKELLELIIVDKFENVELCQDEKVRQ
jgi:hypothetical protein